jgi:glycosyltransferase involved in cell wall biosynthesis
VTFVLPGISKGGSGGTHSIYQEVAAMYALGLPARIAVAAASWSKVTEAYADAEQLFVPYADQDELRALTAGDDVLVATHYTSVPLIAALIADRPGCLSAYYVQDYEPLFSAAGSESALAAERSYREIPGAVLFAKTAWLQQTLAERQRLPVARVEASIDHEVFHVRGRRAPGDVVHVVAMVRPRTPRRAPAETVEVLGRLAEHHGAAVRVTTFGCEPAAFAKLGACAAIDHRGLLSRDAVADVLRDADVFLDCSWYQAFGRTGLEAMSCGATAVLPRIGGATEFARAGENCLLTDTWDVETTTAAVSRLVDDRALLARLQDEAVTTAAGYSAVRAALSEYALFCAEHRRRAGAETVPARLTGP